MSTLTPPAPQTGPGGKIKEGLAFHPVRVAVLTVSDTRDEESDTSGALLASRVADAGHVLAGRSMVPDEVSAMAQSAAADIRQAGGNPFNEDQLPRAIVTLRQGVGRLIRDETDRGLLMLCDPRLKSKSYGRKVLASLPPMPVLASLGDAENWLQGLRPA